MKIYVGAKKYTIGLESSPTTITLEKDYIVMETKRNHSTDDSDEELLLETSVITYIEYEEVTRVKVFNI